MVNAECKLYIYNRNNIGCVYYLFKAYVFKHPFIELLGLEKRHVVGVVVVVDVLGVRTHDDTQVIITVLARLGDNALSRVRGRTGLDALNVFVVVGLEVGIDNPVCRYKIAFIAHIRRRHCVFVCGADFREDRKIQRVLRNLCKVVCGGVLTFCIKAVCVDVMRTFGTYTHGKVVHHAYEVLDASAAYVIGEYVRSLVSGLDEHTVKQLSDSNLFARL